MLAVLCTLLVAPAFALDDFIDPGERSVDNKAGLWCRMYRLLALRVARRVCDLALQGPSSGLTPPQSSGARGLPAASSVDSVRRTAVFLFVAACAWCASWLPLLRSQ
jgi:hypothetical protein